MEVAEFNKAVQDWVEKSLHNRHMSDLNSHYSAESAQTIKEMGYRALVPIRELCADLDHYGINNDPQGRGMLSYFLPGLVSDIVGVDSFLKPEERHGVSEIGHFVGFSAETMVRVTLQWLDQNIDQYVTESE